jgi:hypothetical protein
MKNPLGLNAASRPCAVSEANARWNQARSMCFVISGEAAERVWLTSRRADAANSLLHTTFLSPRVN